MASTQSQIKSALDTIANAIAADENTLANLATAAQGVIASQAALVTKFQSLGADIVNNANANPLSAGTPAAVTAQSQLGQWNALVAEHTATATKAQAIVTAAS